MPNISSTACREKRGCPTTPRPLADSASCEYGQVHRLLPRRWPFLHRAPSSARPSSPHTPALRVQASAEPPESPRSRSHTVHSRSGIDKPIQLIRQVHITCRHAEGSCPSSCAHWQNDKPCIPENPLRKQAPPTIRNGLCALCALRGQSGACATARNGQRRKPGAAQITQRFSTGTARKTGCAQRAP